MTFTVTNSNHECLLWEINILKIMLSAVVMNIKKTEKQGLYFVGMLL